MVLAGLTNALRLSRSGIQLPGSNIRVVHGAEDGDFRLFESAINSLRLG